MSISATFRCLGGVRGGQNLPVFDRGFCQRSVPTESRSTRDLVSMRGECLGEQLLHTLRCVIFRQQSCVVGPGPPQGAVFTLAAAEGGLSGRPRGWKPFRSRPAARCAVSVRGFHSLVRYSGLS